MEESFEDNGSRRMTDGNSSERDPALADSHLRGILESIADGFMTVDRDWRFVFVSRRTEEILGEMKRVQSLSGRTYWEAFPYVAGTELETRLRRAMESGKPDQAEYLNPVSNTWYEIRLYPTREGLSIFFQDMTQRKRDADELRQQREWLTVTLRSIGDGVIATDNEGKITFLNPVAERMTGWKSEEARGQPLNQVLKIINQHTREPAPIAVEKSISERRIVGWPNLTALIAKDGSETGIEESVAPITDEAGNITGAVMVLYNVTKRRRAEEALRETEARWRGVFDHAAVGIALTSLEGGFQKVNQKFEEILGYSSEELRHRQISELIHPEDRMKAGEKMDRLLAGEFSHFVNEKRYVRKSGSPVWTLTTVTVLKDELGNPLRLIEVIKDISARKEAEAAIRDETRILELLNQTGKAISAKLDLESVVQQVTDAATKLCGAEFGAFFHNFDERREKHSFFFTLSGAPREAFERFGQPRATSLFGATFRGEKAIRSDDISQDPRYGRNGPHFGLPEGHPPVRSYLAVPVILRSGEVIGGLFFGHSKPAMFSERSERLIVGVASQAAIAIDNARLYEAAQKEIAERKKVEEELRKAQEELNRHAEELEEQVARRTASLEEAVVQLEEFSYSVSHDLRAPIRAIEGYTRLLREDYGELLPAEGRRYLERISRGSHRMQRLVNDVLTMSRVARADMRLQPIPLERLIEEIVEQHPEMQAPAAEVTIDAPHSAIGDEVSMNQAVFNLLVNAVKFVAPGVKPSVRVVSEIREGNVRLSIIDNGIGIPPEHRNKLFSMFQRLPSSSGYEGTGIGLAIVRKAVERMGGTLGVASDGKNGSHFWIELKQG